MEITEAKVKLTESRSDRLQAFCTITLDDDFVIRDLKVIEGSKGPFVAMPSRKLTDKCPKCGGKNHLRARFCNDCGNRLDENRASRDERGRAKLHADIAHPINSACRERIQTRILKAFLEEMKRARQPGYVPASLYDDDFDDLTHFEKGSFGETKGHEKPYDTQEPSDADPLATRPDDDIPPLLEEEAEKKEETDSPTEEKKDDAGSSADETKRLDDDFSSGIFG